MDVATIMEAAGQEISLGTVEGMTAQKEEVLDTSTVQSFQATETDPLPVVEGPDDAPVEVEDDQDVPEEASGLANLIQAQVGEYQLAGQEVNQPMLDAGAVEAIQLGYVRVSDEAFTLHGIELWQDEATAASVNSERAMYLANQGLEPIGSVESHRFGRQRDRHRTGASGDQRGRQHLRGSCLEQPEDLGLGDRPRRYRLLQQPSVLIQSDKR